MQDTARVQCPCCGEQVTIQLDLGGATRQSYIEDCQVCCRPWQVTVTVREGEATVDLELAD